MVQLEKGLGKKMKNSHNLRLNRRIFLAPIRKKSEILFKFQPKETFLLVFTSQTIQANYENSADEPIFFNSVAR